MVKILLILLLLTSIAYAEPITPVWEWPLSERVSSSTVVLDTLYWVTAGTVQGRKEITILNTSSSANVFLSGVSENTVSSYTLYPRQSVTLRISSELPIYVSANSVVTLNIIEIK